MHEMTYDPLSAADTASAWPAGALVSALLTLTAQLSSCPPLPQAAQFLLEELLALTGARSGWVQLPGSLCRTSGAGEAPDPARLAAWNRFVTVTGRPVLDRHPAATPAQLTDVVALPLRHDETVFGVVGLVGCPPCALGDLAGLEALCFPLAYRLAHGPCGGSASLLLADTLHTLQGQLDALLRPGALGHPAAVQPVLRGMTQQLIRLRALLADGPTSDDRPCV